MRLIHVVAKQLLSTMGKFLTDVTYVYEELQIRHLANKTQQLIWCVRFISS
jgi:hypothetical protein